MTFRLAGLLPGVLAALAACQSAPESTASAPTAPVGPSASVAPLAPAAPAATPPGRPAYAGYHCYQGTVGGQPVVLELTIEGVGDSVKLTGSYFYDRRAGGRLQLAAPRPYRPGQPLQLTETDENQAGQATGRWQAAQPAGPVLTGTWRSPAGRQLPFSLREEYTDGHGHVAAVRYEVLAEEAEAPCEPPRETAEDSALYRERQQSWRDRYHEEFLHLLGADTLRPALRRLQCPPPARRRQAVSPGPDGECAGRDYTLQVSYNAHGLLTLDQQANEDFHGAHPSHEFTTATFDLRTGRPLSLPALLRPGADVALSRLLTRRIEQQYDITREEFLAHAEGDSTLVPLPGRGLGVVPEGLSFQYNTYEILAYVYGPTTVVVPWMELLPLLRPDTPVARMLRERGLWRPAR